jgi:hypothetical protein
MARGGKRPGAGRKKGTPNRASAARELEAQASGETPADVLLGAMREFWRLAKESTSARKRDAHIRAAVAVARDAAPYFHAKRLPTADPDGAAGATEVVHRVEVIGGLPRGSTPEKPEGDDYSDVPPEQPAWTARARPHPGD